MFIIIAVMVILGVVITDVLVFKGEQVWGLFIFVIGDSYLNTSFGMELS